MFTRRQQLFIFGNNRVTGGGPERLVSTPRVAYDLRKSNDLSSVTASGSTATGRLVAERGKKPGLTKHKKI